MRSSSITAALTCFVWICASASAQDITVSRVGGTDDFNYHGQTGGIAAYNFGTTSCNPSQVEVNWTTEDHPVIGQNFYRLKQGRFVQLGQSWLKHGFCAVNEFSCGACITTSCDTLGIGCADTYSSGLNDGSGGGPKYQVNATTGVHLDPHANPAGPSTLRGRLQVPVVDIDPAQNVGALWFAEGQYVSKHEALAGNAGNSVSWRKLRVDSVNSVHSDGPTVMEQAATYAWRSQDSQVTVVDVTNDDEGGVGVHGHFSVAYRVTDLGGGLWRYNYVVENISSTQSAGTWSVPAPQDVSLSNFFFRDVGYHSGEPYDGSDWTASHAGGQLTWSTTQTHAQNADANAIRWGTLYSFGFDANSQPTPGVGVIGLFAPGSGNVVTVPVEGPTGGGGGNWSYCFGDSGNCPCQNHGAPGHGCFNGSFASGAQLNDSGSPSISADTLVLNSTNSTPGAPGLYFEGSTRIAGGLGMPFGDGLRCVGGNIQRLQLRSADGSGSASTTLAISVRGNASAGTTLYYQFWYRDPHLSPCLGNFNLTNGRAVTWTP